MGNAIAKLTKVLGIPHCDKCEKRRLILNEIHRLGIKETTRRMMAVEKTANKDQERALGEVVKKLTDCCKDGNGNTK